MKWFDRWFKKKCIDAWSSRDEPEQYLPSVMSSKKLAREGEDRPWGDGLRINVKQVMGGSVVTFFCYDRNTDRHDDRHYIITDEADFNTELGKLITMESMRG